MGGFELNIEDLTLEQKIGQMIMAGFPSDSFDDHVREIIHEHHIGNIILFSRNVGDSNQIQSLTREIQENMMEAIGLPALISIDQEGGMVTRIFDGATLLPGSMGISATGNVDNARKVGEIMGRELKALGINMNLAPTLDVNNNPLNPVIGVRSYGEDPQQVADFGLEYIRALQGQGVVATAKHFPGHGDTQVDSHLDLPLVPHTIDRLNQVELYPFKIAIKGGADAIMTAHILFKELAEENRPATLSYNIITKLLREELGFDKIVITDCMEMKAISEYYGTANAAVMAIDAGADLILVSHTLKTQIETVNEIKSAVLEGKISMERIDESVERILAMKQKYGIVDTTKLASGNIASKVASEEHRAIAKSISQDSITVVKDYKRLLPVKTDDILTISPNPALMTGVEDSSNMVDSFAKMAADRLGGEYSVMEVDPDESYIESMAKQSEGRDLVVVGTYNANLNLGQVKLIEEIHSRNENIIVVALRNPYDILRFQYISTYICAYEYTPLSVYSLLEILSGDREPVGKLPISLDME